MSMAQHHVVIIGGGFGGLAAVQALKRDPVQVTLLDRRNFHLFQPLLFQVATGGLSPANIASPLRAILKRQANAEVFLADVSDIDVAGRRVIYDAGSMGYDTLIVAAGARHHYFGHDQWEPLAPGLKTIEDATAMRRRIFLAFEAAERSSDPQAVASWLTFVIVGAGPTGVELAGMLAELARHTLRRNFRHIDPATARILLVEGLDRPLPGYPPQLSIKAAAYLQRLGVSLRTGTVITAIEPEAVTLGAGDKTERIAARTVLWAAGVQASRLGGILATALGITPDRAGRLPVQPDLTLAGHPEILVIGDMALCRDESGQPLPGLAPVAMQQGIYAANLISARLHKRILASFRYRDRGMMATIGRNAAVAQIKGVRMGGFLAWVAWLFVHLISIVEFQNRILVLIQWAGNYFTRNRSARLVTGDQPFRDPPLGI
jgi:NADH dehydrogenase